MLFPARRAYILMRSRNETKSMPAKIKRDKKYDYDWADAADDEVDWEKAGDPRQEEEDEEEDEEESGEEGEKGDGKKEEEDEYGDEDYSYDPRFQSDDAVSLKVVNDAVAGLRYMRWESGCPLHNKAVKILLAMLRSQNKITYNIRKEINILRGKRCAKFLKKLDTPGLEAIVLPYYTCVAKHKLIMENANEYIRDEVYYDLGDKNIYDAFSFYFDTPGASKDDVFDVFLHHYGKFLDTYATRLHRLFLKKPKEDNDAGRRAAKKDVYNSMICLWKSVKSAEKIPIMENTIESIIRKKVERVFDVEDGSMKIIISEIAPTFRLSETYTHIPDMRDPNIPQEFQDALNESMNGHSKPEIGYVVAVRVKVGDTICVHNMLIREYDFERASAFSISYDEKNGIQKKKLQVSQAHQMIIPPRGVYYPGMKPYFYNVAYVEDSMFDIMMQAYKLCYPNVNLPELYDLQESMNGVDFEKRDKYPVNVEYHEEKEYRYFLVENTVEGLTAPSKNYFMFLHWQPIVGVSLQKNMDALNFVPFPKQEKEHKKRVNNKNIQVPHPHSIEREEDPVAFKDHDGEEILMDEFTELDKNGRSVHSLRYPTVVAERLKPDNVTHFYVNDMDKGTIWRCETKNTTAYMTLHFYRCCIEVRVSRIMKAQGKQTFFDFRMGLGAGAGHPFRQYLRENPSALQVWRESWRGVKENAKVGKWSSTSDEKQAKSKAKKAYKPREDELIAYDDEKVREFMAQHKIKDLRTGEAAWRRHVVNRAKGIVEAWLEGNKTRLVVLLQQYPANQMAREWVRETVESRMIEGLLQLPAYESDMERLFDTSTQTMPLMWKEYLEENKENPVKKSEHKRPAKKSDHKRPAKKSEHNKKREGPAKKKAFKRR